MTDGNEQAGRPRDISTDRAEDPGQVPESPGVSSREATRRLDTLIRTIPGIVFRRVLHPDGSLTYPHVSASAESYLGYAPDALRVARDGCLDVVHWADRDAYLARVHRSARSGEPCVEDFRAIARGGEVRWLSGTSMPTEQPDGTILWDGVLIDITDRKHAEQWLEMVMNHAADVILTINDEGIIESSNAASEAVFGYAPDALIGQSVALIMPELERLCQDSCLHRVLAGKDSTLLGSGGGEFLAQHRTGHPFPIEVALSEVLTEGKRFFVGVIRDIKDRKAAETALRETQQRLTNIADNIPGLVFQRILTAEGALRYLYVSGGSLQVLGHPPEAVTRDSALLLNALDPSDRERFLAGLRRSAQTLAPMEDDYKVTSVTGEERWLRGWSRPTRAANGAVMWEGVALDVTDRKRTEERLLFLAYHDPLTGLGNRSLFLERFKSLDGTGGDAPGEDPAPTLRRVALVSMGLDRFGIINATMGHTMGDRVLAAVAGRLKDSLDGEDLLCRIGGDRFLALMVDVPDDDALEARLERVRLQFGTPLEIGGQVFDLSVSLGVSLCPDHGTQAEILIMHADAALHLAKDQGGGISHMFTHEMGERANRILTMRHRMRLALERNEFVAHFQPQLDLRTGRIVGSEALARWESTDDGQIPPGEFIPIAEEYGLIDDICIQVLEDACRWTARWNRLGLGDISVAVNISGRQFHDAQQLVEIVDTALTTLKLPPTLLELELTESSAMNDPENASRVMRLFAERGVGCSIDDFGTGYSSLSVLKRFSLRKLKIDRSFVRDVTQEANDAAICSAIIAMAHALNLKVCAEGVETLEQLDYLRSQSCDQVQGYLIARPLPPQEMEDLLTRGIPASLRLGPVRGAPRYSTAIPGP
ncbi:sensor domain-containing protein [Roseospira visakhapatnamensis]|uniref:Diguanylate cyclase (GGDEF)-like protein/PAS domain S-box-containing protein n=1 Tax=Roseospira visakhapatnamensis TaxID=390880 RepID=A0A7W6WA85_9PROT|nr:EAL domain-containing protein [Roseospira visakhapatnamensis]MBB4266207.1 diguanylate cyclase (GGDEF)-like protein/PAS domain S-box-containing protein [Roseospira visakhapatnamensis]